MDAWGAGSYEDTAADIAPVSDVAVAALGLSGGARVLDVACGTGNAALVAHRAGAIVTGLDGSRRLLDVARERIPDGEFVQGEITQLPFDHERFDAAVSVFGVIFARSPEQAAAEIARVVRPEGRVAVTTWPSRGPMFGAIAVMRRALALVRPPESESAPLDWGDPPTLEALLAPYGDVEVAEHQLAHRQASPEEFWDRWERSHPMWIAARRDLEPAGGWEPMREEAIAALRADGMGEGATSPYLLAVLTRPGA